ncbi:MAG: threonine synthase [Desulfobacterales bacterium C00003106]|jgi:threonine synthase|nr:MAG: threonine synthase [Desulfobacterales bacterium C00003106]OEU59210.1 MAG: threonine synthase [Desulfobacterales bacterium C00003104]
MKVEKFPGRIQPYLLPKVDGEIVYRCLLCNKEFDIKKLLYTCPVCGSVLLLEDKAADRLKKIPGAVWRDLFDYRKMLNVRAMRGIYRYHEFIGPILPLDSIVYLGEGDTPVIEANGLLQNKVGRKFYFKNDGQNPSASFKDRGMASALSYINYLIGTGSVSEILAVCASTGDTSASAALYASYLQPKIKSAVLLPHKKVTPQQLAQPLGSGAAVFEIPGVFDDCMKVVEALSENYNVALLNSKNAWRILGQESYSYEIAQQFDYDIDNKALVVPIGNAGNITAIISGFLKFFETGIITTLPKIIGVQSVHADPVFRYYLEPDSKKRVFEPVTVRPSVAQAAMIGNPVSMPRVIHLVKKYNETAREQRVFFVDVTEQSIMDWQLTANRNGHIVCTQGGESLAGLVEAIADGIVEKNEEVICDSTAHALKFSGFQEMYFEDRFPEGYEIRPKREFRNTPRLVRPKVLKEVPEPGKPLPPKQFEEFVRITSEEIASILDLKKKH